MPTSKILFKLIFIIVSWSTLITESSGDASATTPSNMLELFKGVIAMWSHERITADMTKDKCPQLYAVTNEDFDKQQEKGVLGSLEMLDKLCPEKNNTALSLPCQGAVGLSSYLCNASTNLRGSNRDWPSPANPFNSSVQSSSPEFLCKSIEDSNLVNKLLTYMTKNPNLQALNISANIPMSQEKCVEACKGDNHHLCRMILQGLKTVEKWEDLKDHPEEKNSLVVEGEVPQVNDNKTQIDQKPANSEVLQNRTDANIITVAPQIQKPATVNVGISQPKPEPSGDHLAVPNSVTQGVSANQSIVNVKGNVNQTETKPQPETQSSPVSGPKENTKTNSAVKQKPDGAVQDADDLEEEKEQKEEEAYTASNVDYPSDEDDSDLGMEGPPGKPTSKISSSQSQNRDNFLDEPEDTHFLVYFIVSVTLTVACYIVYIRRNRFLALFVEGRSGSSSRRRSVSRPSSSGYRKLVNNLEEVITSSQSVAKSNVIY